MRSVPVERVFLQHHAVVDPPSIEQVGTVAHKLSRLHPIVPIFGNEIGADRIECGKGAEIEKVGGRLAQRHLKRSFIKCLHSDF